MGVDPVKHRERLQDVPRGVRVCASKLVGASVERVPQW